MDRFTAALADFLVSSPAWMGSEPSALRKSHPHLRKEAAVLVLLHMRDGQPFLFLTKRSEKLKNHPGEICFPGGTRDAPDDSPQTTALRESMEEVGLCEKQVRIVGVVSPMLTRTHLVLYPVIAELTDPHFVPTPNEEVQFCFWLPLRRFLLDENQTLHKFQMGDKVMRTRFFTDRVLTCQNRYEDVTTFGITAWICCVVAMAYFDQCPNHLKVDFGLRNDNMVTPSLAVTGWTALLKQFYDLQKESLEKRDSKAKL